MKINKVKHADMVKQFVTVPREVYKLDMKPLSLKLYIYLASRPPSWAVMVRGLARL